MRQLALVAAVAALAGCPQSVVRFDIDSGTGGGAGGGAGGGTGGGDAGSTCTGTQLPCGAGGVCTDVQVDPAYCGACGTTCPVPVHATATCVAGVCGRTACQPGFFDFEPSVPGCETSCVVNVCTLVDGGTVTLTAAPIAETGGQWTAPVSGGSHGQAVQTSAQYTNVGQLGEPTPGGSVEQTGGTYKNVGGFNSMLRK